MYIQVRPFIEEEAYDVGDCCHRLWKNSKEYSKYNVDTRVYKYLKSIPSNDNMLGLAAFDLYNEPVGIMIGGVADFWFGPDTFSYDVIFWVDRSYRNLNTFIKLLRPFEKWAIGKGVKRITFTVTSGVMIEKTRRLFMSLGYDLLGYKLGKTL